MKKIVFFVIMSAVILFTGCDLERLPYSGYTEETIKRDPEGAFDMLLTGIYGQMKDWGNQFHRVGEYSGDNITIRGTSTDNFFDFISFSHRANNGRLNTCWTNSYRVISQSSDVIKIFATPPSTEVAHQIGEAYYMRGMAYFYLALTYGRPYYQSPETNLGVPIINGRPEDILADNIVLPDRATVKETYAQVIRDLRRAESLMTLPKANRYATKEAAQALLSRVYLYMSGTYENPNLVYADSAIYYANQVIQSGRFELLSRNDFMRYNRTVPESNKETIFAIKRVAAEFPSNSNYNSYIGGMYAALGGAGYGEMYASAKYLDRLRLSGNGNADNDARSSFIVPQYQLNAAGEKQPAFRFVRDTYSESGVQTAYDYEQFPVERKTDGSYVAIAPSGEFPLTPVDAVNNRYSIDYRPANAPAVVTYEGDLDYLMVLNRTLLMFYIYKCSLQEPSVTHLHSPTISRVGELYLNLAEAYAKKGDYANALINLNIIRNRAVVGGGYPDGYLTATNAVEVIDNERALELAYEAHRSFDVFRIGRPLVRRYPIPVPIMDDISPMDNRVVKQIPQDVVNAYFGTITPNPL